MKRLFKLGLVALMGVCGFVGISRADDPEPTTPTTITVPDLTFTPANDAEVEPGSTVTFDVPSEFVEATATMEKAVFVVYVFGNDEVNLQLTGEQLKTFLMDMEEPSDCHIAMFSAVGGYEDGEDEPAPGATIQVTVPTTAAAGSLKMRALMVVATVEIDDDDDMTLTPYYSAEASATYTVKAVAPSPKPSFDVVDGTSVAYRAQVTASLTLDEGDVNRYLIYYVIDKPDFDFSDYMLDEDIEAVDGVKYINNNGSFILTKTGTVRAATCRYNDGALSAWSEVESASYTVEAPIAPTFDPEGGEVTSGTTVQIKSDYNNNAVKIYYTTDGSEPTTGSTEYTESIEITETTTIKAIVVDKDDNTIKSTVADATYTIVSGSVDPEEPTFTITAASNGTKGEDDVITFDGMAAFKLKVEGLTKENDTNYQFEVDIYGDSENPFAVTDSKFIPATDTVAEFENLYNGDYFISFYLSAKSVNKEWVRGDDQSFDIKVTNYAEPVPVPDPVFTVTAAGKHTMDADTVVFDSIATFKMSLVPAEGDTTTYRIMAQLFTKEAFDNFGDFITEYSYDAADTVAEFAGVYNGEYGVHFYAEKVYTKSGEPEEVGDASDFHFDVTNYAEPVYVDPEMTIAVAGKNELVGDTVVVFDGAAAFKMKVGEMSAGDSLKIAAVLYTKINYDTFGEPMTTFSYEATDTAAEFLGVWNGEYAVRFELQRYNLMLRDFALITDTVIYFNVTNYEEPVENYELTAVPVGAGENNTFSTAEVAFDITVTGMTEADSNLLVYAKVYTKAQYENFDSVGIVSLKAAASVRFNDTLENGEYVAEFQLMRATEWGDFATNSEPVTINFSVNTETANESAELAGVNVYPNPNAGAFNVAVPERARVEIFGLNGAMLMSREVNAGVAAFNLDHSGIYFVRVMAGNKTAVKRVIVR